MRNLFPGVWSGIMWQLDNNDGAIRVSQGAMSTSCRTAKPRDGLLGREKL